MKTLKFLTVACIILVINSNLNAQSTSSKETYQDWSFYIDCMGENAVGTITLHWVFHYDKDGNLTKYHAQPQAGVLIGDVTGIVYHCGGVSQEQIKSPSSNGTFNDIFINEGGVVGVTKDGRAIKWGGRDVWHVQVSKDGITITRVDKSVTYCIL